MRVLLSVLVVMLSLTAACAGGKELRLKGGERAALPGVTDVMVSLTDVVDQRCPSYADCYWEGLIRVELTVKRRATTEIVVLCNMCDDATREAVVAGRRVTLMRLEPGREVLDPLSRLVVLEDYTVVLAVE